MKQSWFVLADDLTGAADCAIAFAKNGMVSDVLFECDAAAVSDAPVLAVDAASRSLPAQEAAHRHAVLLERHYRKGMRLYKKLDSLLRGQPAAETAAAIRALRGMGAVSAGLIVATGIKLAPALRSNPMGLGAAALVAAGSFVAIAWLRVPLAWVLLLIGGLSCGWAACRLRQLARRQQQERP